MANRSDRGREQPAVTSRASKPAKQNGTSSAETIRDRGPDRANRPHTRLHPDQACQTLTNPLQRGSHPHKTAPRPSMPNPHRALARREPSTQDTQGARAKLVRWWWSGVFGEIYG